MLQSILSLLFLPKVSGRSCRHFFEQGGTWSPFLFLYVKYLNKLSGSRWIGRASPVAWPPPSEELTLVISFLSDISRTMYSLPILVQLLRWSQNLGVYRFYLQSYASKSDEKLRVSHAIFLSWIGGHFENLLSLVELASFVFVMKWVIELLDPWGLPKLWSSPIVSFWTPCTLSDNACLGIPKPEQLTIIVHCMYADELMCRTVTIHSYINIVYRSDF